MSVEYFIHMDEILLSMWIIFGLRGENIPKRFYVVHKKFVCVLTIHSSHAHYSCSHDSYVDQMSIGMGAHQETIH